MIVTDSNGNQQNISVVSSSSAYQVFDTFNTYPQGQQCTDLDGIVQCRPLYFSVAGSLKATIPSA